MKKRRGHYCRICQQYRANERFSGKGHAAHICKDCHSRGNKPSEVKPAPPVYADIDDMNGLETDFALDIETDGYPYAAPADPPKPKKKRKPDKEKLIRASQKQQAKGFLQRILANGDVSAAEIQEKAAKAGFPHEALHRAKGSLRIVAVSAEKGSVWRLPKTGNEYHQQGGEKGQP